MIQNEEIWLIKDRSDSHRWKRRREWLEMVWPYTNESNEWAGEEEWFDLIWEKKKTLVEVIKNDMIIKEVRE